MSLDLRKQQEICEAALELPHAERAAFVQLETEGNDEDCARILALLREYESSDDVLKNALWPGTDLSNQIVGAYRLLEKIGEGGMGEVYLAEQKDRYSKQRVAIKLLTRVTNTPELAERLRREKDVLAQLNHPNIPKLMYSGEHHGAPYIVMEYIAGHNILEYCDTQKLNLEERLDLFLEVLDATTFAHAELIVHRDLKPENILVDTQGKVKVLDFGIAKFLSDTDNKSSATEHFGRLPLSPGYAPPEQWLGQKANTVIDVYALGVLLNQLFCGRMPFTKENLDRQRNQLGYVPRRRSMLEALTNAEDDEKAEVADIAANRQTTPTQLRKTISGDLQSIVFKATEPQRERRYASAADLAADILRYRGGEMVSARAVTPLYKVSRWLDRNWIPASIASTIIVLTSIIAMMGITNAIQSQKQAEETERARASTDQVLVILTDMLDTNDPDAMQPKDMTIREALKRGSDRVINDLTEAPEIQARVLSRVGAIYKKLGLHNEALTYLEAAQNALERLPEGSEAREELTAVSFEIYSNLGDALLGTGEYEEALRVLDKALRLAQDIHGDVSGPTLNVLNSFAEVLMYQRRYSDAVDAAKHALAVADQLDITTFRERAMAYNNFAASQVHTGQLADGIAALREAIRLQEIGLPEDHPEIERVKVNLAGYLVMYNQNDEAAKIYRAVIASSDARGMGRNRTFIQSVFGLGSIELHAGKPEAARNLLKQALSVHERYKKESDYEVMLTRLMLSIADSAVGDFDAAESVLQPAYRASVEHHPSATMTARVYARFGALALLREDTATAEDLLERATRIIDATEKVPPHHRAAVLSLAGQLKFLNGDRDGARRNLTEACELFDARYGKTSALGAQAHNWLDDIDST